MLLFTSTHWNLLHYLLSDAKKLGQLKYVYSVYILLQGHIILWLQIYLQWLRQLEIIQLPSNRSCCVPFFIVFLCHILVRNFTYYGCQLPLYLKDCARRYVEAHFGSVVFNYSSVCSTLETKEVFRSFFHHKSNFISIEQK